MGNISQKPPNITHHDETVKPLNILSKNKFKVRVIGTILS